MGVQAPRANAYGGVGLLADVRNRNLKEAGLGKEPLGNFHQSVHFGQTHAGFGGMDAFYIPDGFVAHMYLLLIADGCLRLRITDGN